MTAAAPPRTSRIWADTIRPDVCKDRTCRKSIIWAQNVRTLKFHPFDRRPEPIEVQREVETGREMWTIGLETSHFATCPGAAKFRRPR